MGSWTPDQWNTFFIFAGGFVTMILIQVSNMIVSLRNGRKVDTAAVETHDKLDLNTTLAKQTQQATNGMTDRLVEAAKVAAFAAGQKAQIEIHANIQAAVDAAKKE